jgi:hypothetical protein
MKNRGWDVDQIVREVVRRLRSHASCEDVAPPPAESPKSKPPRKPDRKPTELCLDERVVTMAAIKDRLQGIRQVRLCPKAVITPSARDEFRKRGIVVERRSAESVVAKGKAALCFAQADVDGNVSGLLREVGGELVSAKGLVDAVQKLAECVSDDRKLGVLLTTRTAPAICLANRLPRVRAALGGSADMVREAVMSVGANLLIIDPTDRPLVDLTNTLQEFLHGGARQCPAEFQNVL